MHKKFLFNLSLLIFANIIIKPFWIFGIDRIVQNTLGEVAYGTYFSLFNYTLLFHLILDLGINNFNNKTIAQQPHLLSTYLPPILLLKVGLAILYFIICWFGAWYLQYDVQQLSLLKWLCLNQVLISFLLYFRSNLGGLHLFRQDSLVSVLDKSIMIFLGALLLISLSSSFNLHYFIYLQTIAYVVSIAVCFGLVARHISTWTFTFNWKLLKEIVKQSYPFALVGILMSIYSRMDAVMLEYLLPNEAGRREVGIYAAAYRLLDAATMIAYLFSTLLLPMFSRMLQEKQKVDTLVILSTKLLFIGSMVLAINSYVFQQPIVEVLYAHATPYYAEILGYLMFSFVASSSIYIYGSLLVANGNLWHINGMALLGCILNLGLNAYWIPLYGALGATVATLVTQLFVASLHIILSIHLVKLKLPLKLLFQLIGFTSVCLFSSLGYTYLNIAWWGQSLLALSTAGIWVFVLQIINIQSIKKMILLGRNS